MLYNTVVDSTIRMYLKVCTYVLKSQMYLKIMK